MSYMKATFAALLVCFAVQAQAQSWSTFGTGKWTKQNTVTATSQCSGAAASDGCYASNTSGGVGLTGGPTSLAQINTLSFSYTANMDLPGSGGSPRLVLMFANGTAFLYPSALVKAGGTVNGKTDNWEINGGTCGFVPQGNWAKVSECFGSQTIDDIFIVLDTGWLLGFDLPLQVTISAVNVNGLPFLPAKDACKNGGWNDLSPVFRNQGECVSYFSR